MKSTLTETNVDPALQEVLRYRLTAIADEMEHTLLRAAYSSIVKEGLDASAAIFDKYGRNIAQAAAIPIHLGCMIPAVEKIVAEYPEEDISPGDVFILNDPYLGGTHLPDIAIIMPVFLEDTLFAFTVTMSHHQEMGGKSPGSLPTDATEIFQEGLQIPPMKLVDRGQEVSQVFQILERNVRTPEVVMGDLRAQLAACTVGARRLRKLNESMTLETLRSTIDGLIRQADLLTRDRIRAMPDGIYTFTDYMDDDGVDRDERISIRATVEIAADTIAIDFTGSSNQVRGPFNCVPASTIAATYYVLRAVIGDDVPNNAGCYHAISLTMPPGSIVNPHRPAAVNSRTATVRRIGDALLGCFSQVIPQEVPAASCGQLLVMNFAGQYESGEYFVASELGVGGMGGRRGLDGIDAVETDATNCMNVPAETLELEAPVRVVSWSLSPDSGGAGKWRGGVGTSKTFEMQSNNITANYRGERHTTSPWGSEGGAPAQRTSASIRRASGSVEELPSKTMLQLNKGDRLTVNISGGGGYGPPLQRDPEAVLWDLKNYRVTQSAAETDYGVVITEDLTVDHLATQQLRAALLKEKEEAKS
jgi:N-methylhydantoinase B